MWKRCKKPRVIRWLDNLRIYIYPGDETSRTLLLSGLIEPNEFYWLKNSLRPGQTFVDIGANMGTYTLFAAKKVGPHGTVVAIEPSSRDFTRLKDNVELNKITNVHLLQVAASNYDGEADLLVATDEHSGHNTLGAFGYSVPLQRKEKVRVMQLDHLVQQLQLTHLDVIKIDVEGAEYAVLQGATATIEQFNPSILLELSDRTLVHQGASSDKVWSFLTKRGYVIHVFDRKTGLISLGERKKQFDSENIVATRSQSERKDKLLKPSKSAETARTAVLKSPGFESFDTAEAMEINRARQDHLASLGLNLANQSILEVGAGVGWHTLFFESLGCTILSTDARPENVREHLQRYPHRAGRVEVADLTVPASHDRFGQFDVVYCYGTLYHLSNPALCIRDLSKICRRVFLLETCVNPQDNGKINLVREDHRNPNQSFHGLGCHPGRDWCVAELHQHFTFVYLTMTQPDHPEFPLTWPAHLLPGIQNARAVFVASREPLNLPTLSPSLLMQQQRIQPTRLTCAKSPD